MSDSLRPHELQHSRPPCPSPTPVVYSNSCPSSWWCHPTISSSVIPLSCPQPCPASGSTRHQKQPTENWAAPLPATIALPTFFQLSRQSPNQLACFCPFHLQPVLYTEARGILFTWKSWYYSDISLLREPNSFEQRPCILFSLSPVSHSHSHRHQSSKVYQPCSSSCKASTGSSAWHTAGASWSSWMNDFQTRCLKSGKVTLRTT